MFLWQSFNNQKEDSPGGLNKQTKQAIHQEETTPPLAKKQSKNKWPSSFESQDGRLSFPQLLKVRLCLFRGRLQIFQHPGHGPSWCSFLSVPLMASCVSGITGILDLDST